MAEDPGAPPDTEDLPHAREAFRAERPREAADNAAGAASRAAALLTIVRPRHVDRRDFRVATEEAREVLDVEPLDDIETGRDQIARMLEGLGASGATLAALLYTTGHSPPEAPEESVAGVRIQRIQRTLFEARRMPDSDRERVREIQSESVDRIAGEGSREIRDSREDAARRLIVASLLDESPVVQVAAAAATLRIDRRNPIAEAILADAERNRQTPAVAELSRAVLATDRATNTRRITVVHPAAPVDPAADSVIVHGTWARWGRWWRPNGALHRYLREEEALFPNLYQGTRPFEWSGYFSFRTWANPGKDWNRRQAGDSLAWWAQRRLVLKPDVIGHSYGGSLAMLATQSEKDVRGLILLSPAVHTSCLPDADHYDAILHVTAKLDLVLLADISMPQLLDRFPRVVCRRVRRRGIIGHGATRNPRTWQQSGLTDYVRDVWLPSLPPRP